ncbi:MAG: hypothetical protein QXZ19_04050, partial [Thermoplasmata archaeon]
VELRKGREKQLPRDRKVKVTRLGIVSGDALSISAGRPLVDLGVAKLAESFNNTLWRMLG